MASRVPTVDGDRAVLDESESDPGEAAPSSASRPRRAWAVAAALAAAGLAFALLLAGAPGRPVRSTGSSRGALIAEAEQAPEREALVMLPGMGKQAGASEGSEEPRTAEDSMAEAVELGKAAGDAREAAKKRGELAEDRVKQAQQAIQDAKESVQKAKRGVKDAEAQIKEGKALREQALKDAEEGSRQQEKAEGDLVLAKKDLDGATSDQAKAQDQKTAAKEAEEASLKKAASSRACVDLPGVRMRPGASENEFRRQVEPGWYPKMDSMSACTEWCKSHASCIQATFSYVGVPEGGNPCHLFEERGEVYDFRDDFNASWCGTLEQTDYLVGEVKKVFEQKPWVGDNFGAVPCGFGGDDCQESRCCGSQTCTWDFSKCEYFKCIRKDENFAGCAAEPGGGWDGEILGYGPSDEDLPAVEDGKLAHPTSLFCFVVMMPGARASAGVQEDEGALVATMKETSSSVYSCDEQLVIEGWVSSGSEANIDAFIQYWGKVKEDGRYMLHDWVIKADADCVFMADRVKAHINQFKPPAGAAVYFRNTAFRFNFMGAFEMMSREGAQVFFENNWQCDAKIGHTGGEDYWMKLCLDTLGLRHISDYALLYDKYAAQNDCVDSWAAAFHFYKTPEQVKSCLNGINR
ncbi:unnamed protein product [Prorocentrum cordatum]|uniref:Apple domain-containing protein n=1 Tax=Prorocentrum cordatum TaxID=2364126 RepID=A0ABN9RCD1_9DINO|nr:unnamed protein product [Polarella glacialis]